MTRPILDTISAVIALRDRLTDRGDREVLAEACGALSLSAEVVRELSAHSISHYGHPSDETAGVGLIHAKARILIKGDHP